jgi:hypothetical protein
LYVDFEGFRGKTPALIGVLIEEELEQIVLDPLLASAARSKNLRISDLKTEVARLLSLASSQERLVIGFTEHEPRTVRTHCGLELGETYADAHKIARRWKNLMHHQKAIPNNKLLNFLRFVKYPVPRHSGIQQSTRRLRHVRDMLAEREEYWRLTPAAKRDWVRFLLHNEHDCRGMRFLMQRVAKELPHHEV